jgi:stearoyl-CoA desaturase (delta-9 desaturase)
MRTGATNIAITLFVVNTVGRLFFITAGYHRYFAHRSYKLNRFWQFVMAFGGSTAAQKGPLWWAGYHREHHSYSDTDADIHSPRKGFWWSHVGWILCDKYKATPDDRITDFAKFGELRFLNRRDWFGPWVLGLVSFLIGGWSGLVIGFFLSTIVVWHCTFLVNSVAHRWGHRYYETGDTSRNNWFIAILTLGEGWHNNHHRYQASARQGYRAWWQWDPTYYVLKVLSWIGIVKDLKQASQKVKTTMRVSA